MTATALSVAPVDFVLRPGTAYAADLSVRARSGLRLPSLCCDGYTQFCCTINNGVNACPPGTFAGGWWKADGSIYCAGTALLHRLHGRVPRLRVRWRQLLPVVRRPTCECALGSCGNRHVGCAEFRYGQCHQEIGCSGRISCRVVSCTPPWLMDSTCTTVAQTDDSTANHFAPCQNGTQEETVTPEDIQNITNSVVSALRHQFVPGGELYGRVVQAVNATIAAERWQHHP